MKRSSKNTTINAQNAVIDGKWHFHPKPQSKPIVFREAVKGLPEESRCEVQYVSPEVREVCKEYKKLNKTKGEDSELKKRLLLKHVGRTGGFIGLRALYWDKVCPTITKNRISLAGHVHPSHRRYLIIEEIQRLSSFPDNYKFVGNFKEQLARLGNCVPPNLMRAIASNLKVSPFLKNTEQPTVVGTFTGCGGSSLGFHLAGFKELLAVEWDNNAVETFKLNHPDAPVYHGDIHDLSVEQVLSLTGLSPGDLDCFQGSPPCQGFSAAGKRDASDPRNKLFEEYVRLLNGLQPKCFVMENVTGMIKSTMKPHYLKILEDLRSCGYTSKGQVMNAKYYHVPQSRERVIIVGVRNDLMGKYVNQISI